MNSEPELFPVTLHLRIDWSEMDVFGHVNNVMILKYIQASRVNYWEHIGLTKYMNLHKTGPMLASTNCVFKKPLHYPGNISLHSRMEFIKNTSFGIQHRLLDDRGDLAAEANDVMVMFDFTKNEKANFPIELRRAAEDLEKRKF
ncbi:MAG: acyl-CoA thioesterase [Bacteroidia bacterium]